MKKRMPPRMGLALAKIRPSKGVLIKALKRAGDSVSILPAERLITGPAKIKPMI
jgi:hypothetical protein